MTAKVKASEIKTKQLPELPGTEGITAIKDLVKAGTEKILIRARVCKINKLQKLFYILINYFSFLKIKHNMVKCFFYLQTLIS